jgi:hypothetical protein
LCLGVPLVRLGALFEGLVGVHLLGVALFLVWFCGVGAQEGWPVVFS